MGLQNREYMRSPYPEPGNDGQPMLVALIIINIVNYILFHNGELALVMNGSFSVLHILQIVTAGFAHADFWHLLFNMWGLYIFGKLVTPYVTRMQFLALYLAGAVTGNLLYYFSNFGSPGILLGSSGALFAVMIAAATLEPNRRFALLFLAFTPIKTSTLVVCYTVLEVLMMLGKHNSGIAHLAHLGGFIGGYILIKIIYGSRLPWDPFRFLKFSGMPKFTPPPSASQPRAESNTNRAAGDVNAPVTQRELDALLDKLSRDGINSLSEYELERLKKARRQMRGEE